MLVQTSKQGMIFMLNRETGEPVAKVEERPVPAGNVKVNATRRRNLTR